MGPFWHRFAEIFVKDFLTEFKAFHSLNFSGENKISSLLELKISVLKVSSNQICFSASFEQQSNYIKILLQLLTKEDKKFSQLQANEKGINYQKIMIFAKLQRRHILWELKTKERHILSDFIIKKVFLFHS